MTSMVAITADEDESSGAARDPFNGNYIEVDETEMRLVSGPQIVLGHVKNRLNEFASAVIYGR